jgi:hypothetical protein
MCKNKDVGIVGIPGIPGRQGQYHLAEKFCGKNALVKG